MFSEDFWLRIVIENWNYFNPLGISQGERDWDSDEAALNEFVSNIIALQSKYHQESHV